MALRDRLPPAHRIGAVLYALWGLLHVWAGAELMIADAGEQLDLLSSAPLPAAELPEALAPLVHAGLGFHGYNLLWFGLLAFAVAVFLNWRNSATGYWVNLVVVGAYDLGLVLFLILPGHLSFADAGLGPVLFFLAFVFTTVGRVRGRGARAGARSGFGAPHPEAPPELSRFAFLVGRWECDVRARDGEGGEVRLTADWEGRFAAEGYAIADEFRMRDREGTLVMAGVNLRSYDPGEERWVMKWLEAKSSTWLDLGPPELGGVAVDEGSITFQTRFRPGEIHRITFSEITAESFRWQADRSLDEGETWEEAVMRIEARRVAAQARSISSSSSAVGR